MAFPTDGRQVLLLIGEVRTFSGPATPPRVMRGETALGRQLERSAGQLEIRRALWNWLRPRCRSKELRRLYKAALRRYASSQGSVVYMVGILLRHTEPDERDISPTGQILAKGSDRQARVELTAR